jgi:hypothetical protein
VGGIQTIQEVDLITLMTEKRGQIEQAQRPGKEVVGREIVDPGIDEEEDRTVAHT